MTRPVCFVLLLLMPLPALAPNPSMLAARGVKGAAAAGGGTLLNNLEAFYRFDEASGDATDSSGNSETLTDNNTVTSGTGKINNARDFEADTTEYFNRSDTSFSQTGDFTVSVWVNQESQGGAGFFGRGVCGYTTTEEIGDWQIAIDNGDIIFYNWTEINDDPDGKVFTASEISTATWYHIVCRRSSGTVTIWLNGVSQTLETPAGTSTGWGNNGFQVGRFFATGDYYHDGLIDLLGVWSRAITDGEIATLYNSGNGHDPTP